jgi:hypothetical protein
MQQHVRSHLDLRFLGSSLSLHWFVFLPWRSLITYTFMHMTKSQSILPVHMSAALGSSLSLQSVVDRSCCERATQAHPLRHTVHSVYTRTRMCAPPFGTQCIRFILAHACACCERADRRTPFGTQCIRMAPDIEQIPNTVAFVWHQTSSRFRIRSHSYGTIHRGSSWAPSPFGTQCIRFMRDTGAHALARHRRTLHPLPSTRLLLPPAAQSACAVTCAMRRGGS